MVEVVEGKRRLEDGWRIWACSWIGIYLAFWLKRSVSAKIEVENVRQEIAGKVREVDDAW
jgi:hypothetical protein